MVAANLHTAVIVNASALHAPLERHLRVLLEVAARIDSATDDGAKVPDSLSVGMSNSDHIHIVYIGTADLHVMHTPAGALASAPRAALLAASAMRAAV